MGKKGTYVAATQALFMVLWHILLLCVMTTCRLYNCYDQKTGGTKTFTVSSFIIYRGCSIIIHNTVLWENFSIVL